MHLYVCVARAVRLPGQRASTNCIRAPPSTATVTPTPTTTRRRLSLPVAAACITRSFPPVGRHRLSARRHRSFTCDFAFFGNFPFTALSLVLFYFFRLFLIILFPSSDRRRACACWPRFRGFFIFVTDINDIGYLYQGLYQVQVRSKFVDRDRHP